MKKINLINDPLNNPRFLLKSKDHRSSMINLFGALSDGSIYFRKKSKLNGSAYLVGIAAIAKKSMRRLNFNSLLENYNYYLDLKVPIHNFKTRINEWTEKDRIPLEFVRIISLTLFKTLESQKKFLIGIFLQIKHVTDRTGTSKFKPPFLLKDILNYRRIYDIGSSMGDGGLSKQQQHISDGSVDGKDLELVKLYLEKLKELKINVWGLSDKSIRIVLGEGINKNMYKLIVQNKFYVGYLNFIYDLPIGDKIKQNLKEPKILLTIKKENQLYLRRFLYRGLFDSDGSYAKGASTINFWSDSPILLSQAKEFLQSSNINFNSTKNAIYIPSEAYRNFLETVGSSHERKLKTILNRLSLPPKQYVLKKINTQKINSGFFNFESINCHVSGLGNLFKEYRDKLGLSQTKYSKEFGIHKGTIKSWEDGLNGIPFRELGRILRLNGLEPYSELYKRFSYIRVGKVNLPLKPSSELLEMVKYITPQKSFNHACLIRREGIKMKDREFTNLINRIEDYFDCKVQINKHNGAFYIYSTYLTSFLDTFFIYEKSWSIMSDEELRAFYDNMNNLLEVDMECKLPFEKIERKVIIKKKVETDPNLGCKPENRSVEDLIKFGVININKPAGPT